MKPFSQMTESERAAWADRERNQRIADLDGVTENGAFEAAQRRSWQRARDVGITKEQATDLCIEASRRERGVR